MSILTFTLNLLGLAGVAMCGFLFLGVLPIVIGDLLDKKDEESKDV